MCYLCTILVFFIFSHIFIIFIIFPQSEEINKALSEAEEVEREIDASRRAYVPVATRASILYFSIANLGLVDPMYQYSLQWFIALFGLV